jgi:hypothetical protein
VRFQGAPVLGLNALELSTVWHVAQWKACGLISPATTFQARSGLTACFGPLFYGPF